MTRTLRITMVAALAASASLAVAACGDSGSASAGSSTAAAATTAAVTDTAATSTAAGTVSANTATFEELVAAFEAAGVPNAEQWAREVEEYRPYDTSDPTLSHLQDELAKYNPDPAVLQKILATLTP
ncbi:MAG: hypothetical protein AB1416_10150 [Actinomycetota bacterium]